MDKDSAMDNPKHTVERKTSPDNKKRKKKGTFPVPSETPDSETSQPSTSTQDNTPGRKLKRKKQEDKEEEEIIEPKKVKTPLRDDGQTKNAERKSFPTKKKQKKKHLNHEPIESSASEPSQPSTSTQDNTQVTTLKRKRQEEEITELKKRKTTLKGSSSSDAEQTATSSQKTEITDKDKFKAKYVEKHQFGEGGYGSIYAGFRKSDNLPVAIKHILKSIIPHKKLDDGNGKMVPSEVAIMLKLRDESIHSDGKAAPVALLDWYDIGREILLVMERPIPCEDLFHYIDTKGGTLEEEEAKIIMTQLIHTAIDLEDRSIFHQDIKTENILIQSHSNTPQARLIDFGVSCLAEKDSILREFSGTPINAPPEAFKGFCSPGSTTVWQLGVVLYETLHYRGDFSTMDFLEGDLMIDSELSEECQDFFKACLNTSEEQRPYLQDLLHHPWLR
ncbi:serine/threonine-protein kinase pim-1-like isoform X1 [Oryzias latipes]|uniref:serine/threonine-protein kinase pim-1-like isoform X1 n=1 Tax=Oryzias latipes TaxID=8090 RepID=UPI000CE26204|nr:serine/threonine-protein kinase pim-1-like isoform X1 [Oryzias latipes]